MVSITHRIFFSAFFLLWGISLHAIGPSASKKAYIIAVSEFNRELGFPNLNSRNDVHYLRKSFDLLGFESIEVHSEGYITYGYAMRILDDILANARIGDEIHLHFSSHGQKIPRKFKYADFDEKLSIIYSEFDNYNQIKSAKGIQALKDINYLDEYLQFWENAGSVDKQEEKNLVKKFLEELAFENAIAFYDTPSKLDETYSGDKHLTATALHEYLKILGEKLGRAGRIIVSLDVAGSGPKESEKKQEGSITVASRSGFFKAAYDNAGHADIIQFSASLYDDVAMEITDEKGESVGAWSYAFYKSIEKLKKKSSYTFRVLSEEIAEQMKVISPRQTPVAAGNLNLTAYYTYDHVIKSNETTSQDKFKNSTKLKGNLYILSIGINEYFPKNSLFSFENCTADAQKLADFFSSQFNELLNYRRSEYKVINKLLLAEKATKENIIKAINEIISNAEPNDYFVFNYSGFTIGLPDAQDSASTWFVPYGLTNFLDTAEVLEKGISLIQLKDLFQFIPADNQLFITEAGNTPKFSREFSKSLIESNPSIAAISARNRVILVPFVEGYDSFTCDNKKIESGPLTHFITTLPSDQNIFGLFEPGNTRRRTEYALRNNEIKCKTFDKAYFEIFYEQKFIEDLKYYLPEQIMKNRGPDPVFDEVEIVNKIGIKHALIIGTDKYKSSKQWADLSNPVLDSRAVADALQNIYGYSVKLLIDPPLDSVYHWLIYYSNNLISSDQFFLFIAGHGDFDEMLDDGMIVCHDSKPSKEDRARNTYIQFSKLSRLINKMLPKQILVVLDVCFGGTFDEQVARLSKRSGYSEMAADAYLNNKLSLKTRLYISSGGKKEVPDGYKGKHSPFAYKLLEALRTAGGSYGLLTSGGMYEFVKKLPSEPLIGSFGDDEPGSEFLLIPQIRFEGSIGK